MTTDRPRSSATVWLAIVVILLPMIYALSIGPACWLVDHGYMAEPALKIYRPIQIAAEYCQPVRVFFRWYLTCWGR